MNITSEGDNQMRPSKKSPSTRPLGPAGPAVSPIGLGCMGFSWAYTIPPAETSVKVIQAAIDSGCTHLDTSDVYGPFDNERLIGRALANGRSEKAVIATKGGLVAHDSFREIRRDGSPEHLMAACDESLKRLGIDVIDLYYLHRVDDEVPVEESWGAMANLVTQGKVRALGVSEPTVDQLHRIHPIHPVAAVQSELSIWTRDPLSEVLPWCTDNNAAFVAFAPLGRGYLAGGLASNEQLNPGDFRASLPRFTPEARSINQQIVDAIAGIARKYGLPNSQICLAWVLAQGPTVHAIPGTTNVDHLITNLAATTLEIDPADLHHLDNLPPAQGSRY